MMLPSHQIESSSNRIAHMALFAEFCNCLCGTSCIRTCTRVRSQGGAGVGGGSRAFLLNINPANGSIELFFLET